MAACQQPDGIGIKPTNSNEDERMLRKILPPNDYFEYTNFLNHLDYEDIQLEKHLNISDFMQSVVSLRNEIQISSIKTDRKNLLYFSGKKELTLPTIKISITLSKDVYSDNLAIHFSENTVFETGEIRRQFLQIFEGLTPAARRVP